MREPGAAGAVDAGAELRERLERAATGLVYTSETDHPFAFFQLPGGDARDLLQPARFAARVGRAGDRVEERTLDDFLAPHLERCDPSDAAARAMRPHYEALKRALRDHLRDVRVLCVGGGAQRRCYLVGLDSAGRIAGLVTEVLAT